MQLITVQFVLVIRQRAVQRHLPLLLLQRHAEYAQMLSEFLYFFSLFLKEDSFRRFDAERLVVTVLNISYLKSRDEQYYAMAINCIAEILFVKFSGHKCNLMHERNYFTYIRENRMCVFAKLTIHRY